MDARTGQLEPSDLALPPVPGQDALPFTAAQAAAAARVLDDIATDAAARLRSSDAERRATRDRERATRRSGARRRTTDAA